MKRIICFTLLFIFSHALSYAQYSEKNYMSEAFSDADIVKMYDNIASWRVQKKQQILKQIATIPQEQKDTLIKDAEQYIGYSWPALPASLYIEYNKTGNRSNYQAVYHERRRILSTLTAAELYEGKGRFLNHVMNGLWVMLEESDWCYPAHLGQKGSKTGLPAPGAYVLDLFAGETSANISWIAFLLQDQLNAICPTIMDRVYYEISNRVWDTYIKIGFTNMGLDKKPSNNWNPWINKNSLYTMVLNPMPKDQFVECLRLMMTSLDNYLNWYPSDGGCDEGPGYWSGSPLFFSELLEQLNELNPEATGRVLSKPLLSKMGEYIYKVQIGGDRYVNFADADSRTYPSAARAYRFGKLTKNQDLISFAAYLSSGNRPDQTSTSSYLADNKKFVESFGNCNTVLGWVFSLATYPDLLKETPKAPLLRFAGYEELGVMTARDTEGSDKGFFIAAQGGHNAESHNHNDVGNFIVYYNTEPVLADVGVGSYTAKTFGTDRYTIWTMQSAWHNTPTINGFMQSNGREFQATDLELTDKPKTAVFKADISKAYPAEAGVTTWIRTLTLNRSKNITLSDNYTLSKVYAPTELNFITPLSVNISKPGEIILTGTDSESQQFSMKMSYNPKQYKAQTESVKITDSRLKSSWGEIMMQRVRLVENSQKPKTSSQIVITYIQ